MLICAYYTEDTPYARIVENLEQSLIALGLRYHIKGYKNRGSWVANCGIKPEFLLDCLGREDATNGLLYVDADSLVRKKPDITCDEVIGVYYKTHRNGERELLSGTIYLKPEAYDLVSAWLEEQIRNPTRWDQKTLDAVIRQRCPKVYCLPQGYTKIFDAKWEGTDETIYVEHFQASREQKSKIPTIRPNAINGVRIRHMIDGSFTIARKNKAIEKQFDEEHIRVPNELRWLPYCTEGERLESIREHFVGKPCYIIGKGPSLDRLKASDFKVDVPIICINESIHKIESLGLGNTIFCMQQDMGLKATCRPKDAMLLVAHAARMHYAGLDNKIVFRAEEFGLKSSLTVIIIMRMVQRFGATSLRLVAFDAINGCVDYADCVGTKPSQGGKPKRFLGHKALVANEAKVEVTYE